MKEEKVVTGVEKRGPLEVKGLENFRPVEERHFETRQIEVISMAGPGINVNIPGREEPIEGHSLISKNTTNPKPLEIAIVGELLRDPSDPQTLYLKAGTVLISGEKGFEALERFEKPKGVLKRLPVRDPDRTQIDDKELRQTGTLRVKVREAIIRLGGRT